MKKITLLLSLLILMTSCFSEKEVEQKTSPEVSGQIESESLSDLIIEEELKEDTTIDIELTNDDLKDTPEVTLIEKWSDTPEIMPIENWSDVMLEIENPDMEVKKEEEPVVTEPKKTTFLKEVVANHNKQEDCYTIIDWKVYDITSFFWTHPGWDKKILWLCWIDWTDKFTNKHGENEKAIMTKDTFYIGDLTE